jgi:uncharacterized membrane-anchored protein
VSPRLTRILLVVGGLLLLGAVDYSIAAKEHIRRSGEVLYLELAPVDPRSLMQGDYMALRFRVADDFAARVLPPTGAGAGRPAGDLPILTLVVDERGIGRLDGSATASGGSSRSRVLRYRVRDERIWLGTNAFFFEEGTADRYREARYGEFRLDPRSGEAILVALRDRNLQPL